MRFSRSSTRRGAGAGPTAALLLALGGVACKDGADEARQMIAAVDALREAPAGAREAQLVALEALKPNDDLARRVQHDCAGAYRGLMDGKRALNQAAKALTAGKHDDSKAAAKQGEELITRASTLMPTCDASLRALREATPQR
jgi:hypothetical protein